MHSSCQASIAYILLFLLVFPNTAIAESTPEKYASDKQRYEQTLRSAQKLGDWPAVGAVWQRIAKLEQDFGKTALARHAYGAALRVAEQHDLDWLAFSIQWDLSKLELAVKRYAQARVHLGKALDIAKPGTRYGQIARGPLLFDYAMLHVHSRQYDRARELLQQSLTYFDAPSEKVARADVLRALGRIEGLRNRHDNARTALTEAIAIYGDNGKDIPRAAALTLLGDLERRQGNIDNARDHYLEALRIYEAKKEISSIARLRGKLDALK